MAVRSVAVVVAVGRNVIEKRLRLSHLVVDSQSSLHTQNIPGELAENSSEHRIDCHPRTPIGAVVADCGSTGHRRSHAVEAVRFVDTADMAVRFRRSKTELIRGLRHHKKAVRRFVGLQVDCTDCYTVLGLHMGVADHTSPGLESTRSRLAVLVVGIWSWCWTVTEMGCDTVRNGFRAMIRRAERQRYSERKELITSCCGLHVELTLPQSCHTAVLHSHNVTAKCQNPDWT
jgi:hypothetical protein